MSQKSYPVLGAGLRTCHYGHLLNRPVTRMDWFEAISENYMNSEGRPMQVLETVRQDYPVALHGVSMSIASPDGIDRKYLDRLRLLVERIQPFVVSDHLCFSRYGRHYLHDLLPFPCTGEALDVVCRNVDAVQGFLKRRLTLENASVYLSYPGAEMSEAEFLQHVVERTGAGVLLDLNNLYVNQRNVGSDPAEYFERIPGDAILQMHLAGYSDPGAFYFDTHSAPVYPPVWELFATAMRLYPLVPVCIEWDEDVPEFAILEEEVEKARRIRRKVIAEDRDYVGFLSMSSTPYAGMLKRPSALNGASDGSEMSSCLIDLEGAGTPEPPRSDESGSRGAPGLAGVQRAFRDLLLSGSADVAFPVAFRPAGELAPSDALLVYAGGYLARREEAVLENYRGTARVLGSPRFYEMVHRYLAENFSTEFDLNRFGRDFWRFLQRHAGTDPLLILAAEVARLDRAFVDVFHRASCTPVDAEALSALNDASDVHVFLSPSIEILSLAPAVYDLWKTRIFEGETGRDEEELDPGKFGGSEILLLYRRQDQVLILRLLPWQRDLMEALRVEPSLARALGGLEGDAATGSSENPGSPPSPTPDEVRAFFARMAREGLIHGISDEARPLNR